MSDVQPVTGNGARIDLAHEQSFALGEHFVSPSTLEVVCSGRSHILQPRVMQVLVALARRKGEVVTRGELVSSCWGGLNISDDAINRCLGRLRRIAELGNRRKFSIETIPRVGYRLTVELGETTETGAVVVPSRQEILPAGFAHRLWLLRRQFAAIAGGALLIAAAIGLYEFLRPAAEKVEVAVLPAEVLSSDPQVRHFAEAMTAQIVGLLADNGIRAAWTQTSARLGAELSLRSSLRADGETLRVRVNIDHVPSGATLWSHEFSRVRGESEALQLEVAAKTADTTAISLLCASNKSNEADTLSLCIRAAELWRASDFPRARVLLEQLVAEDPKIAHTHLMLASAALGQKAIARGDERKALLAEARREAELGLTLDPTLTDAHRLLSNALPTREWMAREALLRKAMTYESKAPAFWKSNANGGFGRLLLDMGRASEAGPYIQQATTLDPLSPSKIVTAVAGLEAVGRLGEAKVLLERCVRIWPQDFAVRLYQRYFMAMYGSHEEAASALKESAKLLPLQSAALEALQSFVDARISRDPSISTIAIHTLSDAANSGLIDSRLAIPAFATLGSLDEAFAQADRLYSDEYAETTVLFMPASASLRNDPRFMTLAKRVGLADYWQASGKWPDFCKAPHTPYDCASTAHGTAAD